MDTNTILLEALNAQCCNENISIGDLKKDVLYPVNFMKNIDTKFGLAVSCVLHDNSTGGTLNVFLPKAIMMTAEACESYNQGEGVRLSLVFRGMKNRSFVIGFERNLL
ncbi:unnamed protein product [Macrosiphum euphorbiae]|uniref:Uncharacterized protein n=1 Tax=Macrosiphum euphorbiae TaxID=13131 RepID=A0AAV0Y638_9HEMI|nr:unnamed protein product [Macrosiphum euphorbiae]